MIKWIEAMIKNKELSVNEKTWKTISVSSCFAKIIKLYLMKRWQVTTLSSLVVIGSLAFEIYSFSLLRDLVIPRDQRVMGHYGMVITHGKSSHY